MLKIAIYDGEIVDPDTLVHLCDIEGSAVPDDRPAFDTLEETLRVLQMCGDRYAVPPFSGPCFTVFIWRVGDGGVTPDATPLARLDGYAHNGEAVASVETGAYPRWDTERVYYGPDDDAVEIVRKILAGQRAA